LGRIDPQAVFGAGVEIDFEAARRVVGDLGRSIGLDERATALGIIEVVETQMERAIHAVSVSEGHDVRSASLVAFGGAGALHAMELARRLEMASVIIPNHAGVLSALGLLLSPLRVDLVTSVDDLDPARIAEISKRAATEVTVRFSDQVARPPQRVEIVALVRYAGQSHELSVPVEVESSEEHLVSAFDRAHHRHNGFSRVGDRVELVAVRATASSVSNVTVPPRTQIRAVSRSRSVITKDGARDVPVLSRGTPEIDGLSGPAVIEDDGSTIWIPHRCSVRVLDRGELELVG
jgi:N-methylhydantoinase A